MDQNKSILDTLTSNLFSAGAIAGLLATIPMTVFILIAHRLLPNWQKYALPPERITNQIAQRLGLRKDMNKQEIVGASLLSHFGYGATMGTMYSSLAGKVPLPAALKGMIFGLIVWAGSYLGWLPAMNFRAAATDEPLRRNLMMISAHIVWGTTTGVLTELLENH